MKLCYKRVNGREMKSVYIGLGMDGEDEYNIAMFLNKNCIMATPWFGENIRYICCSSNEQYAICKHFVSSSRK